MHLKKTKTRPVYSGQVNPASHPNREKSHSQCDRYDNGTASVGFDMLFAALKSPFPKNFCRRPFTLGGSLFAKKSRYYSLSQVFYATIIAPPKSALSRVFCLTKTRRYDKIFHHIQRIITMKNFLFDLDGTLTDPKEGITRSVEYALLKFGIETEDRNSLCPFIGPPLVDSFSRFYGFDEQKSVLAVKYYREYFSERGIFENEVYSGIPPLLSSLKEKGAKIYLATSKPEEYAVRILEHFDLYQYFDGVCGSTFDGSRVKKGDVIAEAKKRYSLCAADCVMVGDRMHDIIGAKENGIISVGAEYGYGGHKELCENGAEYTAKTVKELEKLLLSLLY